MSEGENRRVVVMVKGRDAVLTHSIGFLVINGGLVRDRRSGAPWWRCLGKTVDIADVQSKADVWS